MTSLYITLPNGKPYRIGRFVDPRHAARAYLALARAGWSVSEEHE